MKPSPGSIEHDKRAQRLADMTVEEFLDTGFKFMFEEADWIRQWGKNPDGTQSACCNLSQSLCAYIARLFDVASARVPNMTLQRMFKEARAQALFWNDRHSPQSPKSRNAHSKTKKEKQLA